MIRINTNRIGANTSIYLPKSVWTTLTIKSDSALTNPIGKDAKLVEVIKHLTHKGFLLWHCHYKVGLPRHLLSMMYNWPYWTSHFWHSHCQKKYSLTFTNVCRNLSSKIRRKSFTGRTGLLFQVPILSTICKRFVKFFCIEVINNSFLWFSPYFYW